MQRFISAHQGAAAEQNHEDNESLKIVMLNNSEARLTEVPPGLSSALHDVHIQAWTPRDAFYNTRHSKNPSPVILHIILIPKEST